MARFPQWIVHEKTTKEDGQLVMVVSINWLHPGAWRLLFKGVRERGYNPWRPVFLSAIVTFIVKRVWGQVRNGSR